MMVGCSSSFDASLWRAQAGSTANDNPRSAMVVSLEKNHMSLGMSREQITDLLGEPDVSATNADHYRIGVSPYGIDSEKFYINYKEDIVVGFGISRD